MKKFLSLFLSLVLALGVFACSSPESSTEDTTSVTQSTKANVILFLQSAYLGSYWVSTDKLSVCSSCGNPTA